MAKICIVTRNAPAANPRVIKEAHALVSAGHKVVVVSGIYGGWAEAQSADILPEGCDVVFVRFGPTAAFPLRVRQVTQRFIARLIARFIDVEAVSFFAHGDAGPALARAARNVRADLYIGHYVDGLGAAARAADNFKVPFAFDAEDFHPGDLPNDTKHAFANRLIERIESYHLPRAAYVTSASPGIADAYSKKYGIERPAVVLNTFQSDQAPDQPTAAGWQKPGPSVYWFSQTIGPNRGLECAIRAIGLTPSRPYLYLRGNPEPDYLVKLRALAAAVGVEDRLQILSPAPPEDMIILASRYDVGLIAETGHTINRQIALTNKQFTYLAAGIPAIMSDVPAHVEFAHEAKGSAFLFSTDDHVSLANALESLLGNPDRLRKARQKSLALSLERFNWSVDARRFLNKVTASLS